MRKRAIHAFIALVLAGLAPSGAAAQESPVNLALFNPVQITSDETAVKIFRLSLICGVNWHVFGLNVGVVARTRGDGSGLVSIADRMDGLQIGLINVIKSKESFRFLPIVNWSF